MSVSGRNIQPNHIHLTNQLTIQLTNSIHLGKLWNTSLTWIGLFSILGSGKKIPSPHPSIPQTPSLKLHPRLLDRCQVVHADDGIHMFDSKDFPSSIQYLLQQLTGLLTPQEMVDEFSHGKSRCR